MTYSEAIKLLRKKMLLTQTEFAELFNVSFGTVNRWESGKFEPSMKQKRKLVEYFKKHKIGVEK